MLRSYRITRQSNYFLSKYCYEILLFALLFHLYGSIFFNDLNFYGTYIRILNAIVMYVASMNSFLQRNQKKSKMSGIIICLFFVNLVLIYFSETPYLMDLRNIFYLIFLSLTLYNIARFLISPHRFDTALISASLAGYLLIIELSVRGFMILYKIDGHGILNHIDFSFHTNTFIDTVYYCTETITSIGFGDILPVSHRAKMATSLLGLTGQFYLVVIMGIMVSKFMSSKQK